MTLRQGAKIALEAERDRLVLTAEELSGRLRVDSELLDQVKAKLDDINATLKED